MGAYDKAYYNDMKDGSHESARQLVPVILEYIKPSSVLDVGCGIGTWLSVFEANGIKEITGIDGDYVDQSMLLIDQKHFIAADLSKSLKIPKKFDLVLCLEVAEHLSADHAENFIRSLCTAGDVILFSAAIPGQGGVQHFNEQYPGYWAAHFSKNGFAAYDVLRQNAWNNQKIDTCYRQNIFFFVKESEAGKYPGITSGPKGTWDIVHPELFQYKEKTLVSHKQVLRTPLHAGWHFIKKFGRLFTRNK